MDYDRGGHRDDRHRSSRYEDRDSHRDSRGHRDDRYGDSRGTSRRGDDRGPPRDYGGGGRPPYHDGPPRRDYNDRGGGDGYRGRGGGRTGMNGGGGRGDDRRGRKESPERRSPTPEGAVPLSKRRRTASGWDVHAPGYEQYSATQAKQTGLFNLPGAHRTQIPAILGIQGLPTPVPIQSFGMGIGNNPNLSRQSRRLYIGSITPDITEQNLADFINTKMVEMSIGSGATGSPPVLAVQCNYEKNYAFVEFKSSDDATAAMALDGIIFVNGPLRIRRPKDYGGVDLSQPDSGQYIPGVVSTNVPDTINKVFVGGLPTYLNEEQTMELLKSFGELKAFNLVRENGGASKGFAFFEYVDPSVTDTAIQSLNGMELADRFLVVQRASVGAKSDAPGIVSNLPYDQFPELPRPIMPAGADTDTSETRILLMLNMVTADGLTDDQEYSELYLDIKEECETFGVVEDLRIPRPVKKDKTKWAPGDVAAQQVSAADAQRLDEAAGVGRVYVKYADTESANQALKALAGRSFGGRSIIATLLSMDSQTTPPINLIFAPEPEAPPPLPH